MFSLHFRHGAEDQSQVGGGAWLEDLTHWPMTPDAGRPLVPVLTLRQSIFVAPTIPEEMAVTVFAPIEHDNGQFKASGVRRFAANDTNELNRHAETDVSVLLHKLGDTELFADKCPFMPKYSMFREKFTENEMAEENEDDYVGVLRSKLFGRPGWLQDEVFPPAQFVFCLQLFEDDLRKADAAFDGLFRGGAAYLFLNQSLKRMPRGKQCGMFFAQFT
jgi:hypothetical protein